MTKIKLLKQSFEDKRGKIIDVLSDGILVIQTKDSIMKLNFGDIRLV